MKELKKINNKKNHILLAPTFSGQMKNYNISSKLNTIIDNILISGEKIIFRPHPLDLTLKGNLKNIKKIVEKYEDNSNFFYDDSHSYIDSYSRAKMLITDFSGTDYTFAYSTLRPVIFFSKKEKKFAKTKISDLFYYKDRTSVGLVSQNVNQLLNSISKINKRKDYNKNKIFNLRKKRIKYVKVSLEQTIKQILKICNKI
jgi:CDP-glycerol glycerophosphotransferase (TagB/SpsB family)